MPNERVLDMIFEPTDLPKSIATTAGCWVVVSGRPAPAINVSPAIARVEFEPAGSCAVHTVDPSARDNAPTPPPKVVVSRDCESGPARPDADAIRSPMLSSPERSLRSQYLPARLLKPRDERANP
jgi:hypothetical protein